jgi:hypothetical protein
VANCNSMEDHIGLFFVLIEAIFGKEMKENKVVKI